MIFYALLLTGTILFFLKFFQTGPNAKLPPQVPWALPFFGHLIVLGSFPCKVLLDWTKKYGPVYIVKFGSFRTVVINDAKIAKEATKLISLSDRPPLKQYIDGAQGRGFAFVDYGKAAEQRNFMMKGLKTFGTNGASVETKSHEEISILLDAFSRVAGEPIPSAGAFTQAGMNSVWAIIMGTRFSEGDPEFKKLVSLIQRLTAIPGVMESLGMFNPWLSNLMPRLTGVTSWVEAYKHLCNFVEGKAAERKETRVKDHPRDITDAYIDQVEKTTDVASTFFPANNCLPMSLAEMLLGAGETVSTAMEWVILYLARYPNVQKKLQAEISAVVTTTRFPVLADRPSMPYTEAVISEVLRITAFTPMALPRYAYADIEVSGYLVPKSSLVILNTYGIQHDPKNWDKPEEFRPDRFLDENGNFRKSDNLVVFGFGKRICVGELIARDQLFLFVTRIFQRFTVKYAGKIPSTEGKFGIVIHPDSFDAIFMERD